MHVQSCCCLLLLLLFFDVLVMAAIMVAWAFNITFATLKKLEKLLEGNWTEVTFAKTSGSVARDRGKIGQWLTCTSLVTIPEVLTKANSTQSLRFKSSELPRSQQGPYRSWKTWKVVEFKNFIFKAWKIMEFNCRSSKVMENYSFVW